MYFESNRSSDDGMLAVGTVVMNRLESGRYPTSVCGVVGQPRQFADGALTNRLDKRHSSWARAERMADAVLAGDRHQGVGGAKFFHTAGHQFTYRNMRYVTLAGGNIFYEKRYPAPGAPAWPSATMFAAAKSSAQPQPVMLARSEDAGSERLSGAPALARPPREPASTVVAAAAAKRGTAQPLVAAAAPALAKPKPGVASAPPAKPIRLAMLSEPPARAAPPRSIADLIALDTKRR